MVPDVAGFNAKYRGWASNATNVFATNGHDDPWQGATANASISTTYLEVRRPLLKRAERGPWEAEVCALRHCPETAPTLVSHVSHSTCH